MWHQDDDTALTLSQQMHTVGHPNFLPADERAAASNNQAAAQADEAPPTAAVSDDDAIYSDDGDLIESQVEACPPTHVTPSKRRRPNSPTAKEVAATSATRTYDAKSDTNLILFTVAPFIGNNSLQVYGKRSFLVNKRSLDIFRDRDFL